MEEKRDHKIYKYTNKVNGKVYIGRTCQSLSRRACGTGSGYKHCTYFYNAIKKYGWENFEGEIIEDNLTDDEALERETFWIKEYMSTDPNIGYNIVETNYRNYKEETRQKISGSLIGKEISEETREKLRQSHLGKKLSKEACEKMGASRRGKPRPPEVIEKMRQANLGRKLSEEHRRKLSEAKKGKYIGEKNPNWGKKMSEETKEKLRQANIGRVPSPEVRKAISERLTGKSTWNKGKKMSKEYCERLKGVSKGKKSPAKKSIVCVETGIEYYSITYAAECTGIGMGNISHVLRAGEEYTAGGFHWKYVSNPEEYVNGTKIRCVETGIEYKSVKYASECTGVKKSNISMALCSGRTAGGFHWEYVDREEDFNAKSPTIDRDDN